MTLRSPNRAEYLKRMAFVVLLALAVYAIIISEKGGGGTFEIWRPERMRFVLIGLIVVGAAACEFRPRGGVPSETKPAEEQGEAIAKPRTVAVSATSADQRVGCYHACRGGRDGTAEGFAVTSDDRVPRVNAPGQVPLESPVSIPPEPKAPSEDSAEDAEAIWAKAREMQHEFIPDEFTDGEYLRLVRKAAVRGHALARIKLGDYAYRRGWIVEAYYWTLLAQLQGTPGLDVALEEIRKTWTREGAPPEYENISPDFSEVQGVFARAVLRLKCRLDVSLARKRLQELADAKCPEAMLYLSRTKTA